MFFFIKKSCFGVGVVFLIKKKMFGVGIDVGVPCNTVQYHAILCNSM